MRQQYHTIRFGGSFARYNRQYSRSVLLFHAPKFAIIYPSILFHQLVWNVHYIVFPSSFSSILPSFTILAHLPLISFRLLRARFPRLLPFAASAPVFCTAGPFFSWFSQFSYITVLHSLDIYSGFALSWYHFNAYLYCEIHRWRDPTSLKPTCSCHCRTLISSHDSIARQQQGFLSAGAEKDIRFVAHFPTWILDSEHRRH